MEIEPKKRKYHEKKKILQSEQRKNHPEQPKACHDGRQKKDNLYGQTTPKMRQIKLRIGIAILVGIDMISKHVFYNLKYLDETALIRPVLNKGISRSLPVPMMIIIGISILGIGVFIWLFIKKHIGRSITILLIAGTLGNLIDRFIY